MNDLPERKYALTKLDAGDYLLPSNDGKTIWRLMQYEDGPSNGLDIPKDRKFWGVWRWIGNDKVVDPDDWDGWVMTDTLLLTRKEAVQATLRAGQAH